MLRYIRTTLSLAVLSGSACEFDMELPNLVIEYSDRPEIEVLALYVVKDGIKRPLDNLIDLMGDELLDLCRGHSETPAPSTREALLASVALTEPTIGFLVEERS